MKKYTQEQAQWCNVSLVHTDFMIGSSEMNVTGYDESKSKIKIIENGVFQI